MFLIVVIIFAIVGMIVCLCDKKSVGSGCAGFFVGGFIGLIVGVAFCGLGGIMAASFAEPIVIEEEIYELVPCSAESDIYLTMTHDSTGTNFNYLRYDSDNKFPVMKSISSHYTTLYLSDEQIPHVSIKTYDFKSPILRYLFWNCYDRDHIFVVPEDHVVFGTSID